MAFWFSKKKQATELREVALPGEVGTVSVPADFVVEMEDDETLLAKPTGEEAITLRFSSISIVKKDSSRRDCGQVCRSACGCRRGRRQSCGGRTVAYCKFMNQNDLTLSIRETTAKVAGCCLSFTLEIQNISFHRLLLPNPQITDLRFKSVAHGVVADWYTHLLISARSCATAILDPGSSKPFDLDARFCDAQIVPAEHDFSSFGRWAVKLSPGEYTVQYHYEVNDRFFDPDSHCTMKHLEREAAQKGAVVWRGQVVSNAITVVRR